MNQISKQDTFNQVYLGLAAQGFKQSANRRGDCLYRGPNGLKCAAGQVIPDDKFEPRFEGHGIVSVLPERWFDGESTSKDLNLMISGLGHNLGTLSELQSIHDASKDPHTMKNQLDYYAEEQGLIIPEIPS